MNFHRLAAAALLALAYLFAQASVAAPTVHYRTMSIDGVNVFYREAGPADAPAVVLLHGFPSSSNMFRNLIPALADRYHVIAPDYPGFGHSDMPDRSQFRYSFAHFADITDTLLTRLGVRSLRALCHGLRRARRLSPGAQASRARHCARHSERQRVRGGAQGVLEADQGVLGERSAGAARGIARGHDARRRRARSISTVSPIARVSIRARGSCDQALLDRPGNVEIQLDLFYDYRTNLELYPQFQKFFRERQPPALIVWGKNDVIFPADGARAYLKDLPRAELHLLDSGHFALEDQGEEIARLMRDFLARTFVQDRKSSLNAHSSHAQHSPVR